MNTSTVKNRSCTSKRGNEVVVFDVKEVAERNGFTGFAGTVRTFAVVNGTEVDMDAGCSFQAERVVAEAGF